MVILAYTLLALALCALWLPPLRLQRGTLAPWSVIFVSACVCGLAAGGLAPTALVWLALLCGAAWLASAHGAPPAAGSAMPPAAAPTGPAAASWWRALHLAAILVTAMLALALAMHLAPGFHNPVVIASTVLSPGAAPYQQYANFDKGAVGLILLAFLSRRCNSAAELVAMLKRSLPILGLTLAAVLGYALAIGYVRPDFKLNQQSAIFLSTNLFFTVMAEEAFFRGLVQGSLATAMRHWRHGAMVAVACSALLFGLVHAGGGPAYVVLATIAGLGYAWAAHATQRIEAAIALHFCVNAVHFICFTYPYLAH